MTDLRIGQDVIVESPSLYEGEAFLTSIAPETRDLQSDGVYVDVSDRDDFDADVALVSRDSVVSLTSVFDLIRELKMHNSRLDSKQLSR